MNTRHWTPRKKQPVKLFCQTKIVRVDSRTQVEVSVSIPDDEAILNYHLRHDIVLRSMKAELAMHPLRPEDCIKEIPVGDVQDLEALIENNTEIE